MHRPNPLIAALFVSGVVASGCSGSPPNQSAEGTFTLQMNKDLGSFDPYQNVNMLSWANLAYDSLVNRKADGTFVSGLAEKWSADARSATFTLRSDVTCSDGTPLTAMQVADAISHVSDPANKSPQYGYNTPTGGVTATGDNVTRTVRVVPKEPFGFLLQTVGQLPIVCAKGLKNPDLLKSASDGTGPFVLTQVVPSQRYILTRRKGYKWGPGGATTQNPRTPKTVVMRVIENETTAANLLISGEVNLIRVAGQDRERLDAQRLTKKEMNTTGAWLWFNQIGDRPTADRRVRQALVQAVDLNEVIRVLTSNTGGNAKPSVGLIAMEPRTCSDNTINGQVPTHSLADAERLLDEAGWTKGTDGTRQKNGKPLTINFRYAQTSAFFKPAAELIAQRWRAVGVSVRISSDSSAEFANVMFETNNYDVYQSAFGFRLPVEMVKYLSGEAPPKGTNIAGISNPAYERLAAEATGMVAPQACALWKQAEQALWRELDPVPLADRSVANYLRNADAQFVGWDLVPTSIRLKR